MNSKSLTFLLIALMSASLFSLQRSSPEFSHPAVRSLASLTSLDSSKYEIFQGGFLDIPNGSFVEGSVDHGGTQPDYRIDYDSREFIALKEYARDLKSTSMPIFDKIQLLQEYINTYVITNKSYNSPAYQALIKNYREEGANVPLSQYRVCSSGVCREHALIFHMAMKEAGINNFHVYVKAFQNGHIEDHAINVIMYKGEEWVVDCYNYLYNGFRLKDLMSEDGIIGGRSIVNSFKVSDNHHRKIMAIHDFPKVYIPKKAKFTRYRKNTPVCIRLLLEFLRL